jgi:hypothetical protein
LPNASQPPRSCINHSDRKALATIWQIGLCGECFAEAIEHSAHVDIDIAAIAAIARCKVVVHTQDAATRAAAHPARRSIADPESAATAAALPITEPEIQRLARIARGGLPDPNPFR